MIKRQPKYIFSQRLKLWDTIAQQLHSNSRLALFLDYDGTLTSIRRTPSAALLSTEAENILRQLTSLPDVNLTIVTGRSMEDIRRLIPFENVGFAANHGFHILHHNGVEWIHPGAVSLIQSLKRLHAILRTYLEVYPQAYVEYKQFTLSIHYRNVADRLVTSLKSLVTRTIHSYDRTLIITRGKKVLEVRPRLTWGKGNAVLEILKALKLQRRGHRLFIGDDITDEDVFKALKSSGITIRVGKSALTHAKYCVKDVDEVLQLLKNIVKLRTQMTD